jgi:RNA polymerase sigma factor (sigma-70 family)
MAEQAGTDIARLVAEHHEVVYRYAYRLCGTPADAEDLTQQTFLAAQQNLSQLRNAAQGRAWLMTILRNGYLKSRRRRFPATAGSLELDLESIPDDLPYPGEIDRQRLQEALDALPPEFKVVLLMFYFEHCTYREIAEQLDLPIGTVMSRLSRAKHQLRGRLLEKESAKLASLSSPVR